MALAGGIFSPRGTTSFNTHAHLYVFYINLHKYNSLMLYQNPWCGLFLLLSSFSVLSFFHPVKTPFLFCFYVYLLVYVHTYYTPIDATEAIKGHQISWN